MSGAAQTAIAAAARSPAIDVGAFDMAAFDLDGVITRTASLHAAAWRELFDDFLHRRAGAAGEAFRPFNVESDYRLYVDGRPRGEGVRAFLASRGIALPEGEADDPPGRDTAHGLGARKDQLFLEHLRQSGVQVFADSVPFVRQLRAMGLKTAIVSSSRNAALVLEAAGLTNLFDIRVDGIEAGQLGLKGKPAPDTFKHAAEKLGVEPARAVGFEDALVGVEALRAAGYGLVVGVDRSGQGDELRRHGADVVTPDLLALEVVRSAAPPARIVPSRARAAPPEAPVQATDEPEWLLVEPGFTLTREHEVESILAIGNGRLGSRGSLAEGSPLSTPATFAAGVFESDPGPTPALAVLPDWSRLSISVDGAPLKLDSGRALEHRRILDLKQGMIWREWRHEDPAGRITHMREMRLASLADPRLLIQSVTVTPENYSGEVRFESGAGPIAVTRPSRGLLAAFATSERLTPAGGAGAASRLETPLAIRAELGRSYRLDRTVAVFDSRSDNEPELAARAEAKRASSGGLSALVARHQEAWRARWAASDIRVEGDPAAQTALRFAGYHLISAANPDDERVSIGARALTGRAYAGHVFWDTEIFMLPFFALTWPEAARALLMYRHHTLPAARAKAVRYGARGAFYAWESADTGEDVTPKVVIAPDGTVTPLLLAEQEQHISADIAFAVWNYWRATGDDDFLLQAGAEIVLETARFWASRGEAGDDGRRHIRRVVGPDEYHEAVDDDAYTNGMARWNLETAAALARLMSERWPERWKYLAGALDLHLGEVDDWDRTAREIYTGLDPHSGLIEQFKGYFGLEDIELAACEPRNAPIDVILGRERVQRSQLIKQPDVVMLLYLLWDQFPPEVREANFRYYEPRCGHGSSLSPAIHALVAARLGDLPLAERYFRQAREIDLANNMGNAAGGIHAGALGGLWQATVFGFAGLRLTDGGPKLHPNLPPAWRELSFRIRLQGREHELKAVHSGAGVREIAQ